MQALPNDRLERAAKAVQAHGDGFSCSGCGDALSKA
jgi:hypothetical protein